MSYVFEEITCNLCQSDNQQVISRKGKFGLPTNVVLCKNCGLGYLSPRWNKESYLQFYQNDYDRYYRPHVQKGRVGAHESSNPIELRLKDLNLLSDNVSHILDIGSGAGNNLFHFRSLFPASQLYAIEPSQSAQRILEREGVTIIGSDVDTAWDDKYKERFDLIIMRHVLEHFMDPVAIMKKVRQVLKPKGIVYVAVPNNLKPTQSLEKSWFRNVHTYYFNKYSLKNLNNIAGLKTLAIVEGDRFNQAEVFLFARKAEDLRAPLFAEQHYLEQHRILTERLKAQRSLRYKGVQFVKGIAKKMFARR